MKAAKTATLLGLIGVSLVFFSDFITFFRVLEHAKVLSICMGILNLTGLGLLLTFFIKMFIYYSRRLSNSNQ